MLQLIVTWQIKLSCDRFTSLIKINVIQYSRNALYICICYGSNFFPVKILPSAPEMLYLYVFFFPVRDSNLLGDRASETTGSTA